MSKTDDQEELVKLPDPKEAIDNYIEEFLPDEEILRMDGFDHAVAGVSERFGGKFALVYDKDEVIRTLVERDGMDWSEAMEWFDFNIIGAWMGEGTPHFLTKIPGVSDRHLADLINTVKSRDLSPEEPSTGPERQFLKWRMGGIQLVLRRLTLMYERGFHTKKPWNKSG